MITTDIANETLELLKIKHLPKTKVDVQFFIENKEGSQLPSIINKTEEKLINSNDFMKKIRNQIGIYDTEKV